MDAIAILTGGGPAPGMNTVVGSVAKTFLKHGYRVLGLHCGYSALFTKTPRITEIDFLLADDIFNRGGSFLTMSRFKPSDKNFEEDFNLELFTKNNIKLLVTVGGDDTASTANRIAKFLAAKHYPIANIHVPKTIDNDLPLPAGSPTFGYQSAKDMGSIIGRTVYTDARTSGNWFVVAAMGRSAGHLAFGIGTACHYPMIVIPEMFNKTEITVEKIVNLVVSSIGYEVRCQTPVAYDLVYCSLLGMGTYKLFSEGKTGCMVYANPAGEISPLYLKDLQDPETGKIPPRLVDINSDKFTMVIKNILNYLTPEDYEAAKKYIANPEAYDFYKILEWDK